MKNITFQLQRCKEDTDRPKEGKKPIDNPAVVKGEQFITVTSNHCHTYEFKIPPQAIAKEAEALIDEGKLGFLRIGEKKKGIFRRFTKRDTKTLTVSNSLNKVSTN